jgi:serine/threonine-protein kinase TNNI3K
VTQLRTQPVFAACAKGHAAAARLLLEHGADPMAAGFQKTTALHVATWDGHLDTVALLLSSALPESAPVVDLADALGTTALHWAAYRGQDAIVRTLCAHGANANTASVALQTPLHLAWSVLPQYVAIFSPLWVCCSAMCHHRCVLELTSVAGLDAGAADKDGHTALHHCCAQGDVRSLNHLAEQLHVPLDVRTVYGDTLLHAACYHGRSEVAKYLLQHLKQQAMLDIENIYGETPLHAACTDGSNIHLVSFLAECHPACLNRQGPDGHTPLHSASLNGHAHIVQLLLTLGADITLRTRDDNATAYMWAYERGAVVGGGFFKLVDFAHPFLIGYDRIVECLQTHTAQTVQQEYDDPADAGAQSLVASMTGLQ